MLSIVMASASKISSKTVSLPSKRAPRSKSTNAQPSKPQTRTLPKTPAPLHKSTSDTSLVNGIRTVNLGRLAVRELPKGATSGGITNAGCNVRKFTNSTKVNCTSLEDIAGLILQNRAKNVIVMAGAGISTPSGIPDFRTPGTGLYDNLKQYKIPYPEAIFDIEFFHYQPKPFFTLAKELYPTGQWKPNNVHYFVRLLHEKGLLLRMYTQNIDGLERLSGIPAEKLVEAHGTFSSATCQRCRHKHSGAEIKGAIFEQKLPRCKKDTCNGIVKPDIVFFGEDLPRRFYLYMSDFPQADLLVVLGTSLQVEPFAGIVDSTRMYVPRLLVNREVVGPFRSRKRINDVTSEGDLLDNVQNLVERLGWTKELDIIKEQQESILSDMMTEKSCDKNAETLDRDVKNDAVTRPTNKIKTKPQPVSDKTQGSSIRKCHTLTQSNSVVRASESQRMFGKANVLPKIPSAMSYRNCRSDSSSSSSTEEETSESTEVSSN